MKTSINLYACGFVLSLLPLAHGQGRWYPTWNASRLSLYALWEASPIIAVGDVVSPIEFGEQSVQRLPHPVSESIHTLFWCEGEFNSVAVVKGDLASPKKRFVWASVNPGCKLFYGDRRSYEKRVTRVWFLREEGEFLRPESDGSSFFYGLFAKWDNTSGRPPKEILGQFLLTPDANAGTLEEYSSIVWQFADFACSLLGRTECVSRIRKLAQLGNPSLRREACRYMRVQQSESCEVSLK